MVKQQPHLSASGILEAMLDGVAEPLPPSVKEEREDVLVERRRTEVGS